MENKKTILSYENVLPEDYDGTFRFTNDSDEDFIGRWDGKEYIFPARTTSPMIILNASPLDVQEIRKRFAKQWAEREYAKSEDYQKLVRQEWNADGTRRIGYSSAAGSYPEKVLYPYIQRCLTPLPGAKAKVVVAERENIEDKLHRDDDGELVTQAVDKGISLKDKFNKKKE